jgi:hypothetical protein
MRGAEAVIVSGARRGEIVTLSQVDSEITMEAQTALDGVVREARRMSTIAREAADQADLVLQELRAMGQARGFFRSSTLTKRRRQHLGYAPATR